MKKLLFVILASLFAVACGSSETRTTVEQAPQVIAANETAAMMRLRAIVTAQFAHAVDSGGEYATLDKLMEKGLLNNPADGKLSGYRFEVKIKPGGFEATAVPERFGITGKRSFYVDESRTLRGADKGGKPASRTDPQA